MKPITLSHFEHLKRVAPFPWYMEQNNNSEVCVKDNRGEEIYFDDFGTIPDEMPTAVATSIRERSRTLAVFLVALSEE